jgi:multidrug resistance efflux pump
MKKLTWISLLIVMTLLAGCGGLPVLGAQAVTSTPDLPLVQENSTVIAEGNVVPGEWVQMVTRTGGEVAEVLVKEGDVVEAGTVLLRFGERETREVALAAAIFEETSARQALDELNKTAVLVTDNAQAAVRSAEKAVMEAQQAVLNAGQVLDDRDSRKYETDLDNARKDVNTFEQDLEDAQKEFNKYKDLDPANNDRKRTSDLLEDAQKKYNDALRKRDLLINQLDQDKAAVDVAEAALAAAEAQLADAQRLADARKDGPDPDQLALLEARLVNAEAQVKAAEKAISDLEVRAPFAATVVDLDAVVGETILPNQPVVLLANFGAWYVETNDLTEIEVVKVVEGQAANVVPDALPALSLPATVESIARQSSKKGGDVTYTVRLVLDDDDPALRWGMTVEVRFAEE